MSNNEKNLILSPEMARLEKKLNAGHVQHLRSLSKPELKNRILELSMAHQKMLSIKAADEQLEEAHNVFKELNKPYTEQTTGIRDEQRLIGLLLEEMAKLDEPTSK